MYMGNCDSEHAQAMDSVAFVAAKTATEKAEQAEQSQIAERQKSALDKALKFAPVLLAFMGG